MLTNVFNKIIDFLEKGEEVEFSCGGPYLQTNWIKNPLDDNDTNVLLYGCFPAKKNYNLCAFQT